MTTATPAAADRVRRDYRRGRLTDWQRDRLDAGGPVPTIGPYRLLAPLGARTFAATGDRGRPVALTDCGPADSESLRRLCRVPLRHPAVLAPPEVLTADDRTWAVAPRAAGPTLAEAVAARGRWEPADAARLARTLAAGLAAAEGAGVIHGQVDARNVRLSPRGPVLVGCGTAPLLAPLDGDRRRGGWAEVTDGPPAFGTEHDLRAYAATVWGVLCGRPPFLLAPPRLGTVDAARPAVPPVRDVAPDTPDELAMVLDALLCGTGNSPASFAEVARLLTPSRPRSSPIRTAAWLAACGATGAGILGAASAPVPDAAPAPAPSAAVRDAEPAAEPGVAAVRRVAVPGGGG